MRECLRPFHCPRQYSRPRGPASGSEEQVVVRLLVASLLALDGVGPVVPVDCDDFVVAPEVDAPLLDELPRFDHEEVFEVGDFAFHVVRQTAGPVRHPIAALEHHNLPVRVVALGLPCRTHACGVSPDDEELACHSVARFNSAAYNGFVRVGTLTITD